MGRKQQKPMIFESKVSPDPLERTVQLGNINRSISSCTSFLTRGIWHDSLRHEAR